MKPSIIVHGGAGDWSPLLHQPGIDGVRKAATIGWDVLLSGGTALEAVEQATIFLEDMPPFDAGVGSFLNELGEVEMDALICDGSRRDFGAVASVKHVKNPITLARLVLTETPHCFVVGDGADRLAIKLGLPYVSNLHFILPDFFEAYRKRHEPAPVLDSLGTVGAVAVDAQGNIAAATSTGGTRDKLPGRVGDSPLYGAGGYADNRYGAASATGKGENIMRVLLSKYAVDQIAGGRTAAQAAVDAAAHINGYFAPSDAGIILVDREGRVGAAHTTPHMPIAWVDEQGSIQTALSGGISV